MVEAISPQEVPGHKEKVYPDFVLRAFNELIAARFDNGRAKVDQDDVVDLICQYAREDQPEFERGKVFSNGWLNVEDIYRAKGWKVTYDKPAYYENYEPHFIFKVP